ncbi:MAG TPA: transglycosylase SLT domain-containing protein [Gammaproteobacteria bacterium]|nr:transglycosylase SLT domain-containing protein [Gammaproteobacteria bacterium]
MPRKSYATDAPTWTLPASGQPYAATIQAAADTYGVPVLVLARVLWQESHFRADIISGEVESATGAQGIAQFMPETAEDYGVDPLDAVSAIYGAAHVLRDYRRLTGDVDWAHAVAAYNAGPGNINDAAAAARKAKANGLLEWLDYLPTSVANQAQTQNYITQVAADLGQVLFV